MLCLAAVPSKLCALRPFGEPIQPSTPSTSKDVRAIRTRAFDSSLSDKMGADRKSAWTFARGHVIRIVLVDP